MKGFPFFKPLLPALVLLGVGCGGDSTDDRTPAGDQLALSSVTIGGQSGLSDFDDVSPDAEIVLDFTAALDAATVEANIYLLDAGGAKVDASDVYDGAKRVTLKPSVGLNAYASYRLIVDSGLKSAAGEAILTGKVIRIRTGLDTSDKFPQISDEELLTKVWGYDTDAELGAVWVYISYLRKRLTALHANVAITAKRGVGYTLEVRE